MPDGSLRATPTRTVPTSTPIQIPVDVRPRHVTLIGRARTASKASRELGGVAAGTLGEIGLAAAARTEHGRERPDQVTRRQPGRLAGVVDRRDERRSPAVGGRREQHDRRLAGAQPAAHVEGERAQVVAADAVGRLRRDELDAVDVLGPAASVPARREHLADAQLARARARPT